MQSPNEQRVERRLAAIFAADVAGYSRLMSQDEAGTLRALAAAREVMDGLIRDHGGRIANTAGDSVLAEFPSAVDAVHCAVTVQEKLAEASAGEPEDRPLQFRIGVHVGDVVVRGGDLLGGGVNVAARLEGFAEPGGIAISGAAHGYVRNALPLAYTDLGEQQVKNIDEPVRAYAVKHASAPAPGSTTLPKPPLPVPEKPSIAVLPFTNMSDYPEQEYFADGIAEDIITTLSHISSLLVIARNSTFAYKGKARDLRHVGRELGVRYILEGSVRRSGDRIRVTAQLVDASDGSHVWAERYDRPLADVFDIQDELTREIVTALRVALTDGEQARVWLRSTENVSAWADAMRGFDHIWRGNASDNEKAKEFFRSAVRRDPQYSRACAMLARTYYFDLRFGYTTQVDAAQQSLTEYTLRALSLDPQEPYAIAMHAHCLWLSGQFEQGVNAAR